jgi:hypothetical protein
MSIPVSLFEHEPDLCSFVGEWGSRKFFDIAVGSWTLETQKIQKEARIQEAEILPGSCFQASPGKVTETLS